MIRRLRDNIATINGLAYVDNVTGLGNRTVLQSCLGSATASGTHGVLFLLDLDGFKDVNDIHGHDVGDRVLEVVGLRICKILGVDRLSNVELESFGGAEQFDGSRVQVVRMGRDEFAIWLPKTNQEMADQLSRDMLKALREPVLVDGAHARIGASIGGAQFPKDATDRNELVKAADLALYDAKRAGKNRLTLFAPALRAALDEKRKLSGEIEQGLERGGAVLPTAVSPARSRSHGCRGACALEPS